MYSIIHGKIPDKFYNGGQWNSFPAAAMSPCFVKPGLNANEHDMQPFVKCVVHSV